MIRITMIYLMLLLLLPLSVGLAFGLKASSEMAKDSFVDISQTSCFLQYYYYIPCPDYSWFWSFSGWLPNDVIGAAFRIGDVSMQAWASCDSAPDYVLESIRVLDFYGLGTVYPGFFTVKFDVYCSDSSGCPIGPSLWTSPPLETSYSWNNIDLDQEVNLGNCFLLKSLPASNLWILVTATHIGSDCTYPAWGMDNISKAIAEGCEMHDAGCLPALYPRPYNSHYSMMHSGYYGPNMQFCPPYHFLDPSDTTATGNQFGHLELAWRIKFRPVSESTEQESWGKIKSLYR